MELTKEYNFIWYGQCGTVENDLGDCEEYVLADADEIEQVWQINDAGDAKVWDKAAQPETPFGDDEFVKLECGHAYYIRLEKNGDTVQTIDIPHAYVSDFAEDGHIHDNPLLLGTCETGAPGPGPSAGTFTLSNATITDELDEGYIHGAANDFDAPDHDGILDSVEGIASYTMETSDNSRLEYFITGGWNALDGTVTIDTNLDSLKLRVATGVPVGTHAVTVTLVATQTDTQFSPVTAPLTYNITVNNVKLDNPQDVTNNLDQGALPVVRKVDIDVQTLGDIVIEANNDKWMISAQQLVVGAGGWVNASAEQLNIDTSGNTTTPTTISVWVVRSGALGGVADETTFTITPTRRGGTGAPPANQDFKCTATPNPLPAIQNFAAGQVAVNVAEAVPNDAVQFAPVLANAPAGAKLKFNISDQDTGVAVGSPDIIRAIGDEKFGDLFDGWGNNFVVTVELVDSSGVSLDPAVVASHIFHIPRVETTISATQIDLGTRDRDSGLFQEWVSETPAIVNGADGATWSVTGNVANVAIQQNGQVLQAKFASADFIGSVNGSVTITTSSLHKFHNEIGQVAETEVSATVNVTGTATDGVVFTSSHSSVPDTTRDTGDAVPSPTKITITYDNVSDFSFNQVGSPLGWKFCKTVDGTFELDSTIFSNDEGKTQNLGHAPGTFEFWALYDTTSVASETFVLTLQPIVTDGQTAQDIVITFTGEVTQAAVPASIAGCDPLTKITLDQGATSNATTNTETCTLDLQDAILANNLIGIDSMSTNGHFNYKIVVDTPESNGLTKYALTYYLDSSRVNTLGDHTDTATIPATLSTGTEWEGHETLTLTFEAEVEAVLIPENSSIALGTCPLNITQDAGIVATQTNCQLQLTNAECTPITNTVNGGLKYSLTDTGLLTYEADNPEAVGEHSHQVTIAANSDNPSTSLFAGQATTATIQVDMSITVEAVVVADDKLWVGFSANGHTEGTQAYTPFYEVEAAEEENVRVDFDNSNYAGFAAIMGGVIPLEWKNSSDEDYATAISEGGTGNLTSTTPAQMLANAGMNVGGTMRPWNTLPDGVTVTDIEGNGGLPILSDDGGTTFYVNVPKELDYTSFKFADGTDSMLTTLDNWFTSSGETKLVEVLMIANPTQPDVTNLTSLASSAYDSDSLSLNCSGTWNEDETDKTKMVFRYQIPDGTVLKFDYPAGATSTGSNISKAGYWTGINAYFTYNQGFTKKADDSQQPKIVEWYFEKVDAGNKIKLSSGNPVGSHCS